MSSFETVNSASIKAYCQVCSDFLTGEGAPPGFIHLTASVLTGRPQDLRREWSLAFANLLQAEFAQVLGTHQAKLTIEIREMDAETYFKG
jgi:5-carboxymethyl-2-hydroxymuconate isomerase